MVRPETFVPKGNDFYENGDQKAQYRKAKGTDETYEWSYCGHGDSNRHSHYHHEGAEGIVGECWATLELVLEAVPRDLEADEELEPEGAEHGERN